MAAENSFVIFDKFNVICVRVSVQYRLISVLEVFIKILFWLIGLSLVPQVTQTYDGALYSQIRFQFRDKMLEFEMNFLVVCHDGF